MNKEEYKAKAKDLLEKLNLETIDRYEYTDEALYLIKEYDWEFGRDFAIVDDDDIEHLIKQNLNDGGWERVYYLMAGTEVCAPYGHRLDAYGNLQKVEFGDIKIWLEDIIND